MYFVQEEHGDSSAGKMMATGEELWYALRVTYARELRVKAWFDGEGIRNFIPMRSVGYEVAGRIRHREEPAIHNLIFVCIDPVRMREIKAHTTLPIRYIMDRESKRPVVIPDKQMEDFIRVAESGRTAEVVSPGEIADLHAGERIRVVEGPFRGIEGRYIRHKGRGRVAVEFPGIAVALTASVPLRCIEKLGEPAAGR